MVQGINWETVGKTLANGFNTVIGALYTFMTTFDWLGLGVSVATGINSALQNADMTLAGKTLGAKVRGMIQFAFGFVTNFEFSGLGQKIADGINGFFEEMGEVRKNTGLTGWQELGKTLSDSVKGLADTIITALDEIKWENIGKAIADFLGKLDWIGIFTRLGIIIGKAIKGVIKVGIAAIKEDPGAIISALTVALGAIFAIKKIKSILNLLKASSIFGDAVGGAISSGVGGIDVAGINKLFQTDVDTYVAIADVIRNCELVANKVAIAICPKGLENQVQITAQAADELLNLNGIESSFVICESDNKIHISGRSNGNLNVQIILEKSVSCIFKPVC